MPSFVLLNQNTTFTWGESESERESDVADEESDVAFFISDAAFALAFTQCE